MRIGPGFQCCLFLWGEHSPGADFHLPRSRGCTWSWEVKPLMAPCLPGLTLVHLACDSLSFPLVLSQMSTCLSLWGHEVWRRQSVPKVLVSLIVGVRLSPHQSPHKWSTDPITTALAVVIVNIHRAKFYFSQKTHQYRLILAMINRRMNWRGIMYMLEG